MDFQGNDWKCATMCNPLETPIKRSTLGCLECQFVRILQNATKRRPKDPEGVQKRAQRRPNQKQGQLEEG